MVTSTHTLQAKTLYSYADDFYAVRQHLFSTARPAPDNSARYVPSALCIVAAIQIISGPAKVAEKKPIAQLANVSKFPPHFGTDHMELTGLTPMNHTKNSDDSIITGALQLSLHSKEHHRAQIFVSKIPEGNLESGRFRLRINDVARHVISPFMAPCNVPNLLFSVQSRRNLDVTVRLDVQILGLESLLKSKQKQPPRELLLFTFVPD